MTGETTASEAGVIVRTAVVGDVPTIAAFNRTMALETEEITIPEDVAVAGVAAVLNTDGPAHDAAAYFVLEQQGTVIGQLMITKEWSDWRAAFIWWIQSVYVAPSHRGKGHFKALYAHVRQAAKAQGAAGLRLYVDNDNKPAQETYKRLGMASHYACYEDMFSAY